MDADESPSADDNEVDLDDLLNSAQQAHIEDVDDESSLSPPAEDPESEPEPEPEPESERRLSSRRSLRTSESPAEDSGGSGGGGGGSGGAVAHAPLGARASVAAILGEEGVRHLSQLSDFSVGFEKVGASTVLFCRAHCLIACSRVVNSCSLSQLV